MSGVEGEPGGAEPPFDRPEEPRTEDERNPRTG